MNAVEKVRRHLEKCLPGENPEDWFAVVEGGRALCLTGCGHDPFEDDAVSQGEAEAICRTLSVSNTLIWQMIYRLLDQEEGPELVLQFCQQNGITLDLPGGSPCQVAA